MAPHTEPAVAASAGTVGSGSSRTLAVAGDAHAFLQQWLAIIVARLPGLASALLLIEDEAGALVPGAMWPEQIADVSPFAEAAQRCVDERRDIVLPLGEPAPAASATTAGSAAHPMARVVVATPIFSNERLIGALVFITSRHAEADLQRAIADVQWGAGWIDALARSRGRDAEQAALLRARRALDLVALVARHERVDDACAAVAAELARAVGGLRVAIGLLKRGGGVRLVALSHAAWFERKSQQAAAIERAMGEAVEQRMSLSWPPVHGDHQRVDQAQHELAVAMPGHDGAAGGVLTVPIVAGARAVGAVVWQLPVDQVSAVFLAQVEGVAVVLAPLLARLQDESRWFSGAAPAAVRQGWALVTDPRRPAFAAGALLLAAILAAAALIPTTYRVPARAGLEGRIQRVLAAPFEGFVAEAPVRAGQRVAQGDLLARLDDRDLSIEEARLTSELAQQEKKLAEAVARHERATAGVLGAQMEETEAKLAQVSERLQRTRIEAPFDGVVVSGDWSQSIGSPVEQGKLLFTLAPLTGYRVVLKVDDRDVRDVEPGQRGALVLSGMAGEKLPFTVRQISVAAAEDGANLFRVEADLDAAHERLRPGMEGVGKIDAGERTLLWIATRRLVDWVRVALWQYLP
jgi:RND family efflux transporter MFP subunit